MQSGGSPDWTAAVSFWAMFADPVNAATVEKSSG